MALTELQLPTKAEFYNQLQNAASQMDKLMTKWENIGEFIGRVDSGDLDSMGVPAGQVRTDLVNFRTVITEVLSLYEGNDVSPTNIPTDVVERIRRFDG